MPRSLKKGPYVHYKLQRKIEQAEKSGKKQVIKTWSRSSMITPDFVGKTLVYIMVNNLSLFLLLKIW